MAAAVPRNMILGHAITENAYGRTGSGFTVGRVPAASLTLFAASGAVLGLALGSFIATLVVRWGAGRSIGGRSRCDGCARQLTPLELVPLIGFALAGGRCRTCGAPIDPAFPATEAAAATLGAVALALEPGWGGLAGAAFGWTLLTLALLDARHLWLPDRLTLPLLAAGLALGALGLAPDFASRSLGAGGALAAFAAIAWGYARLRSREGLGQGDVKLLGAIGAWLGWQPLPMVVAGAAALGLIIVALRLLRGATVRATDPLPFGTLLAAAAFGVWMMLAAQE